jgi:predicted dehydrogenase
MGTLNRRDFLKDSAFLAAAMAGAGTLRAAEPTEKKDKVKGGASEQLRVAVVGVNGRGMDHVGSHEGRRPGESGHGFLDKELNCVITHICDCDERVIGSAMKRVEAAQGKMPTYEKDIRKLVEDKTIDIITIATPNHWHALAAIWAMQNGKDVYVEKPVSHNVSEGRRIVEAARKYKRICQAGTQSRSSTGLRDAMDFLHNDKLGKIKLSRGLCYKRRPSIGKVKGPQEPPKTMDYDLWCGPAPNKPPMRNGTHGPVHYDWHWIWDYGNGDLGNQGIHEMDKARWALNKNELPKAVVSVGGRFGYVDDGETANTQICVYDYGDCELIFEVRGLPTKDLKGASVGNIMYGTEGYMVCTNYYSATAFDLDGKVIKEFKGGESHYANFVKAVRSRKVEDQNADILEGHLSSALCHLGNISYRLGSDLAFNKAGKAFGDDKEAAETLLRMEDHLKENKVPLDDTKCRVGKSLKIDAKKEAFVDDKDANAMLTREYRKGFEVPAKV